jgi:hypothetical protein
MHVIKIVAPKERTVVDQWRDSSPMNWETNLVKVIEVDKAQSSLHKSNLVHI